MTFNEAIGAYLVCALLLTLVGITGTFERLLRHLPNSLAAALLAGILFRIGSEIFLAAQSQLLLVLAMLFSYLLIKRLQPRYAVLAALLVARRWPAPTVCSTCRRYRCSWPSRSGQRRRSASVQ